MEENFNCENLDFLVIKDKKYVLKKRIKLLLIIIILVIIAAIIVVVFVVTKKPEINGGKIRCVYERTKNDENIRLINENCDVIFKLIIEDTSFDKKYFHSFE